MVCIFAIVILSTIGALFNVCSTLETISDLLALSDVRTAVGTYHTSMKRRYKSYRLEANKK